MINVNGKVPTFTNSGATDHCFVNQGAFYEYETLDTPKNSQSALVEGVFYIVSQGTVQRTVQTKDKMSKLVFCRALHTPDLATNLISIGRFDEAGFTTVFSQGKAVFSDASRHEVLVR